MADPVPIRRKPAPFATWMSLSRVEGEDQVKAVWHNPVDGQWETSDSRFDGYDEYWDFNASKDMSGNRIESRDGPRQETGDRIWVRDAGIHEESTRPYDRTKYHPLMYGRYLNNVWCQIFADNGRGRTTLARTLAFGKPAKPKILVETDDSTGDITFTVESEEEQGPNERYRTSWRIERQDSANRNNAYKTATSVMSGEDTDLSFDAVFDYDTVGALSLGQWSKLTMKAYNQGLAGDSAESWAGFVIAHPAKAEVTGITVSGPAATDVVTVRCDLHIDKMTAPVSSCKLQRLRSTPIESAASAAAASGWADVDGAVDTHPSNGWAWDDTGGGEWNVEGFSDIVADSKPSGTTHTWYRVVTQHAGFTRYSEPVDATCLRDIAAPSSDDDVEIASVVPGDDGTSLACLMGWDADDSTATEVSWSVNADAWESTEEPSSYVVRRQDATSQVPGRDRSATLVVRGLEAGVPVYVRARRIAELGDSTEYGEWCVAPSGSYPATPAAVPSDVRLSAPAAVPRGQGIDVSWSSTGHRAWVLYRHDGGARKVVAEGEGQSSFAVPARVYGQAASIRLSVSLSNGGRWTESGPVDVTVAEPPAVTVSVPQVLTAQPLSVSLTSTSKLAEAVVKVFSRGASGYWPDGRRNQPEGECVWSDRRPVAWAAATEGYEGSVTAPTLELWQGVSYDVEAYIVDGDGLVSDVSRASFEVGYSHKPGPPSDQTSVTVDPDALSVEISPVAPSGYVAGDVYDVYRATPDGTVLVAEGIPFGSSVVDPYAPYGTDELRYTVATRTPDGYFEPREFRYSLPRSGMRIDWDGRSVDLPWNVGVGDSYAKDFEERAHMDGSRAGYWNEGRSRTSALSGDLRRHGDEETLALLRELASYSGPAFVRTSDGLAFSANVDVDGLETRYGVETVSPSLKATEVELPAEFRATQGGGA